MTGLYGGLWMPGVEILPSPNHSSRRDADVLALVLHIEGGAESATDSWFLTAAAVYQSQHPGDANVPGSAHFGVAKDGTVRQFVSVAEAAWANGITTDPVPADHGHAKWLLDRIGNHGGENDPSPNRFTVSIEHEGQPGDPFVGGQFSASAKVAAWLFGPSGPLAGVPCDRDHVLRHSEIGSHPQCPGFTENDIDAYILLVNALLKGDDVETTPVQNADATAFIQKFVANETALVARNNGAAIDAVVGNPRQFVITFPNDAG